MGDSILVSAFSEERGRLRMLQLLCLKYERGNGVKLKSLCHGTVLLGFCLWSRSVQFYRRVAEAFQNKHSGVVIELEKPETVAFHAITSINIFLEIGGQ